MTETLAPWMAALASALVAFLWQGALVGAAAWAALRALRRARPQLRYLVACIALLLCVSLPVAGVVSTMLAADAAPGVRVVPPLAGALQVVDGMGLQATPHWTAPPLATLPWIVALWAAGTCLCSVRLLLGLAWIRRACREAQPERGPLQASVVRLSRTLGVRRRVQLRLCEGGDGPVVAGWWKPVVLLPFAVAARIPAPLLEALLAHELAHVRRHDYLVNLLQGVVEALLFHHPVTWWLSRRIRIERELIADDLAARAIGDGRRLAVALSELDRLQATGPALHAVFPATHIAHAALGGQLMPRIHRLVRPDRHLPRAAAALPLVLLLAAGAGAAAYAHARAADPGTQKPGTSTTAAPARASATTGPRADARTARGNGDRVAIHRAPSRDGRVAPYALVRGGDAGIVMSGDLDDIADIRAAGRGPGDEYLWFRRDGRAWTVRDPGVLAQVRDVRHEDDALSAQMQVLDARMQPHNARMQALSQRMETLSNGLEARSPEMEAASTRMEALGKRMEALGREQGALGAQMAGADEAGRAKLDARMRALDARQRALSDEMEHDSRVMQRASQDMQARQAPMQALGDQMQAASRPMEAIGKDMETLGNRIEARAEVSNAAIARLIDDAWTRGLAKPVSSR